MKCRATDLVLTEATLENLEDLWLAEEGRLPPDRVRRVTLEQALVDTDCTTLALPTRIMQQLGLAKESDNPARGWVQGVRAPYHEPLLLTIQGRSMTVCPVELPDGTPALVGLVPLTMLDLVPDLQGRRLTGNPAHGGEWMLHV
jgi:hypothetical protein